jgi:glyoxalase family protein
MAFDPSQVNYPPYFPNFFQQFPRNTAPQLVLSLPIMNNRISAIHHITAIAGDPRQNMDFYTHVMNLRLVKLTVNYDDPGTYHFYFGDSVGTPGTILTFFPWANAARGRHGSGCAETTSFRVNQNAIPYWVDRFAANAVDFDSPSTVFGREVLTFRDHDGLRLALVADETSDITSLNLTDLHPENAIVGFDSISLAVAQAEKTIRHLTDIFGAKVYATEGKMTRLHLGGAPAEIGSIVDVIETSNAPLGQMGAGSVHHVAFRCSTDEEQITWRERLMAADFRVSEVRERHYFRSIYFHEPGGILFEIATDKPGFGVDESPDRLGTSLKLPSWLEERRTWIESRLPKLKLPLQKLSE